MRRLATVTAALLASLVSASAESFRSDYAVSLYGLTLARSSFQSEIAPDGFEVKGRLRSAGLAAIFDETSGSVVARGAFDGAAARPTLFRTDYTANGKVKMTEVTFRGGTVASAVNRPEVNTRRKSWVPTRPGDLAGVADPISGTLVKAGSPREVCDRTLQIFDGAMRADLKLSYRSTRQVSIKGYKGDAVVCSARFTPISGYRKNYKSIQYMRKSSGITIAFAPVGATGVYAPVEAAIGTQIGTVTVRATRFEAAGG